MAPPPVRQVPIVKYEHTGSPRRARGPLLIALGIVFAGALAVGALLLPRGRTIVYESLPIEHRALVQTVTASGTVNPKDTISVGTQASGTLSALYVDFNSRVRAGEVLARIDPLQFQAAVNQARGALQQSEAQYDAMTAGARASAASAVSAGASAHASTWSAASARETEVAEHDAIAGADADVRKALSALSLARLTVSRNVTLLSHGYLAQSQVDSDRTGLVTTQSAYDAAVATAGQLRAQAAAGTGAAYASASQSEAQVASASGAIEQHNDAVSAASAQRAAITQQRAALEQATINLSHTVITSPVDGTVVQRNVSIGQTVAASFQTPTLFTIAQDLRKMEVDVAVGEPDVGNVRAGDPADFTVLAFPNRVFHGYVFRVNQNPTTVANVVTYDTIVYVDNRDGALRPGMTANATIHVAKIQGAERRAARGAHLQSVAKPHV